MFFLPENNGSSKVAATRLLRLSNSESNGATILSNLYGKRRKINLQGYIGGSAAEWFRALVL